MKKHGFHVGSFLIGLLAGAIVLVTLAMSVPPRTETQTNALLQNKTDQIQVSATQSVKKVSVQVQDELSAFHQHVLQPVSRWSSLQVSATQSVHKAMAWVQGALSTFRQHILQPVSRWFSQGWERVVASIHPTASPACSVLAWAGQARTNFLALLGIHSQPWKLPGC